MEITLKYMRDFVHKYKDIIDSEAVTMAPSAVADIGMVLEGDPEAKEKFVLWPAYIPKRMAYCTLFGVTIPLPVSFNQYMEYHRYDVFEHWRSRKTVAKQTVVQMVPTRGNVKTIMQNFSGISITPQALDIINQFVEEEKRYDAIAPRLFKLRESGKPAPNEDFHGWSKDPQFTPFVHQTVIQEFLRHLDNFANLSDMGVGKTYIEIACIKDKILNGEIDRAFVFCPKNLTRNVWVKQIRRFSDLRISVIEGNPKQKRAAINDAADVYICGFDSAWRPSVFEKLLPHIDNRTLVILDEATFIKNHSAKRAKAMHEIARLTPYRHILTGTPVTQSVQDVFSLWLFLDLGKTFGVSHQSFMGKFFYTSQYSHGYKMHPWAPETIGDMISKQSIRYMKSEVMQHLPPKVYDTIDCVMGEQQNHNYQLMKEEFIAYLDSGEVLEAPAVIAQLTRLSQITGGFLPNAQGEPVYFKDACKPAIALELIQTAVGSGQSTVVWCRYRAEIEYLNWLLGKNNIASAKFYSKTKEWERENAVDDFQAGKIPVFIGQPASGGVGLDLWKACNQIWFSHIYSYAMRIQAEDRSHREGSQIHESVQYTDLCARQMNGKDTIDQYILKLVMEKKSVADVVTKDYMKSIITML